MNESRFSRFRKWFANTFVFFGPGLLLAITAAGEAGITEAIEIGAHYGLALLWVVIITLLFKYAFTNGIARYTLATGHTIFDALGKLPGPKNWGPILVIVSYMLEMFAVGAMILFAATFLDYLLPGVFSIFLLSITLLIAALALLRTHIYHHFEQIMAVIVIVMGISLILVLTSFPFTPDMILSGIVPNIPAGSETAILAILGVVGEKNMSDIFEKCRNFKDAKIAMRMGIYGYFQPIESAQGPEIVLNGKTYIMAGSNNYLGLANDPEMKKVAAEAALKYGTGCAGSRFLNGNTKAQDDLEKRIAKFKRKEAGLIFSTHPARRQFRQGRSHPAPYGRCGVPQRRLLHPQSKSGYHLGS